MKKPKILLVLSSIEYISNFIGTKAIELKNDFYEIEILVPEGLKNKIPKEVQNEIHTLNETTFEYRKDFFVLFSEILGYKNRRKSKSFRFRERRNSSLAILREVIISRKRIRRIPTGDSRGPTRVLNILGGVLSNSINVLVVALKIKGKKYLVRMLSMKPLFPIVEEIHGSKMKAPEELMKFLGEKQFDIIVLPTAAYEPIVTHLASAKSSFRYKYLLIADNWDNLSSKTILWQRSDYIATWGKQSSEHAIKIHGYESDTVFEIGTARFCKHNEVTNFSQSKTDVFKHVLFVGTFLKFNEYACLKILNDEILGNPKRYGDLKILYRPHPFRPQASIESISGLNRVEISSTFGSITFQESLNQIIDSKFVVGGLSSMLIESSLLGRNYLALAHHEKFNLTSPKRVLQSYEHFSGINELPNLFLAHNKVDLVDLFRTLFNSGNCPKQDIMEKLSYFYRIDSQTYSQRFNGIIGQICSRESI